MRSELAKKRLHRIAHILLRIRNRDSRLEPRRHAHPADVVVARRFRLQWKPDVGRRVRSETASQHPDRLVRLIVERNDSAYEGGVPPETPAPQTIADHRYVRPARPVLRLRKAAADRDLRAEQPEVIRRYTRSFERLRKFTFGEVDAPAASVIRS